MSIGEANDRSVSLAPNLRPRPIPDDVANSHADAWRTIRAGAWGLGLWRTIAFACELPAFGVFAAAAFMALRWFTHSDAISGAAKAAASPVAGASLVTVLGLAACGALLWIAAHIARGAYAAYVLDTLRGERRALGPWLKRRWPALVGWGAIELATVVGLALLAAFGAFALYSALTTVWGVLLPGPESAPSLAYATAHPPWLLIGALTTVWTLIVAAGLGALLLAIGYVWFGLRLVSWRLADDADSLGAAVGDSWRWIRGRRRAWWAMTVAWSAAMPFALIVPVFGWYAASLLGWTWSGAFYDRIAAPQPDASSAAQSAGAAVPSPRRAWARVDNALLGLQAAITLTAFTMVIVLAGGTLYAVTAAKRAAWEPNVNALPFIVIAVSAVVGFAASIGLVTAFLRRSEPWPAASGWSRLHVYTGLVGLAVVLSLGRGASAVAKALNGGAAYVRQDNDARWVAEALPAGFQAPTHAYADPRLQQITDALDRKTESIPFQSLDANGDRYAFAYVPFKSSVDAKAELGDLARTASADVAAGRTRYTQGEWVNEVAQIGYVVIVAVAPDRQAERLGDAMDALVGRARSRVGGAGGE